MTTTQAQTFDAFVPNVIPKFLDIAKFEPRYVSFEQLRSLALNTPAAQASLEYARKICAPDIFAHSVRCYYFSLAFIHNNFPSNTPGVRQITFEELNKRLYHTSVLHDLGLTYAPEALEHPASTMTFEFHGGIMAYEHLHAVHEEDQAIADITQSIMLHTVNLPAGFGSAVGMLLRLALRLDLIGFDGMGPNSFGSLIHKKTIAEIELAFPRKNLGGEFGEITDRELKQKPNCIRSSWDPTFVPRAMALKSIASNEGSEDEE